MNLKGDCLAEKAPQSLWKIITQRRYILTFLVFWGYFNIYSLRVNMSIAIVAMTENKSTILVNGTEIWNGPEFAWDNVVQGYVLSSFFYGYLTTQLIGGVLGKKFGGKRVFGLGVVSTALITFVSPWLIKLHLFVLIAARILMGIFEGVTFASLYTIWAKWIPPAERSRVTTQANSGSYTGAVFAMMFFSYLAKTAGWKSIFWFSGGLGLLWYAAWIYFVAESPESDLRITKWELKYIRTSLTDTSDVLKKTKNPIPWCSFFTSKAVWALNVSLFCEAWGFYTLLTLLPKYFKDVFQFNISKSGIVSALPYIAIAIMMQISGQIADRVIMKNWLTVTNTRKAFMSIGFLSQTCFMLGAAFWGNAVSTIFCLVMAVGLGSFAIATISVNALDIAPLHSGLVFGIVNTIGTVPGVVSPIVAGYIVDTANPTVDQWRIVFYITAGLYLFGALFYGTFATGRRQTWDEICLNRKEDDTSIETRVVE
ncbi:vesicular glutamate transporter 1-like [Euwallacea similis]|uniref:vesicular glutamate transporter 1-like n=1 Tax=Euwallacea similis TaxID=1736056 RepID=UPI00344B1C87